MIQLIFQSHILQKLLQHKYSNKKLKVALISHFFLKHWITIQLYIHHLLPLALNPAPMYLPPTPAEPSAVATRDQWCCRVRLAAPLRLSHPIRRGAIKLKIGMTATSLYPPHENSIRDTSLHRRCHCQYQNVMHKPRSSGSICTCLTTLAMKRWIRKSPLLHVFYKSGHAWVAP